MHHCNHLYWFLFVSYRGVVLVLVVLVMTRLSSPKTVFICISFCVFWFWRFIGSPFLERFYLSPRSLFPLPPPFLGRRRHRTRAPSAGLGVGLTGLEADRIGYQPGLHPDLGWPRGRPVRVVPRPAPRFGPVLRPAASATGPAFTPAWADLWAGLHSKSSFCFKLR